MPWTSSGLNGSRSSRVRAGTDCVAKLVAEEQRAAAAVPKKGELIKLLPPGTQLSLTRQPDGSWTGQLAAAGKSVAATGVAEAGPQSVIVMMARLWAAEAGVAPEPSKP